MNQQNFTTRIVSYVEKSTRSTKAAPAYNRLVRSTIFGIAPVTHRVHEHVTTLINSAQHRAECGDHYNCRLMINNAVGIMGTRDYHDATHDHGARVFHEVD